MGPMLGKQPFNPALMKPKYAEKANVPEKKIDEALIAKLFLYVDEGIPSKIKQFVNENRMLVNVKNPNGLSPIHAIISSKEMLIDDKITMVKYLLLRGASAVAYDKFNVTPLHLAVKYQISELVDVLLKYGADPNALDSNNMNALHYAVVGMSEDCIVPERKKEIIPKEKKDKPVSEETKIIQSLINNVNLLLFKWVEPQRYFKNFYNNIQNYGELYKKEIEVNKEDLLNKVLEIINNKSVDIDRKQEMVQSEVNKTADNLKNIFIKDIKPALINLSDYYSYDESNNLVKINNDKFSPDTIEKQLLQNVSRASDDIIKVTDSLKEKIDENTQKIMAVRESLIDVRWLNKTLVINYAFNDEDVVLNNALNRALEITNNAVIGNAPFNAAPFNAAAITPQRLAEIGIIAVSLFLLQPPLTVPQTNAALFSTYVHLAIIGNSVLTLRAAINPNGNIIADALEAANFAHNQLTQTNPIISEISGITDQITQHAVTFPATAVGDFSAQVPFIVARIAAIYIYHAKQVGIAIANMQQQIINNHQNRNINDINLNINFKGAIHAPNIAALNDVAIKETDLDTHYVLPLAKNNLRKYDMITDETGAGSNHNIAHGQAVYNIPNFDLDLNNKYSTTAKKYKKQTKKFIKENPRTTVNDNILGYDNIIANINSSNKLNDHVNAGGQTYSFKFNSDYNIIDIATNRKKLYEYDLKADATFMKPIYYINEIIKFRLEVVKKNISLINKFLEYYEFWNIMVHMIPSAIIAITSTLRMLANLNRELDENKDKLDTIKNLFTAKTNDVQYRDVPHFWVYENAIDALDSAIKEYNSLKPNVLESYNIVKNLYEKYNNLIDHLNVINGFKLTKSYHNNFIENNQYFLESDFTKIRYMSDSFDYYKIDLSYFKDKKLENLIDPNTANERATYYNTFLKNLTTTNTFYYDNPNYFTDISNNLRVTANEYYYPNYPENNKITPFNTNMRFMNFNPYTAATYYQDLSSNLLFKINNTEGKKEKNEIVIKPILGNHYLFNKYFLVHYLSNIFTSIDHSGNPIYDTINKPAETYLNNIYKNIQQNLVEYKTLITSKLNLDEREIKNNELKILVEIISESADNWIEFLLKKKSQEEGYKLLTKYDISNNTYESLNFDISGSFYKNAEIYPLIKSDKDFENLGLKTKLSVEEILDEDLDEYGDFIDADIIREKPKKEIYQLEENMCYSVDFNIIKKLIDKKTYLGQKDNSGKMPINYALEMKNLSLMKSLTFDSNYSYYKNNEEVVNYFNDLMKDIIGEIVRENKYNAFYEKYKNKMVKKLEAKPEINTNILSSIEYTIPMYMSLLNSMLFNNLLNFNYGFKYDDLKKFITLTSGNKETFYGPLFDIINASQPFTNFSNSRKLKSLREKLENLSAKLRLETIRITDLSDNIFDQSNNITTKLDEIRLKELETSKSESETLNQEYSDAKTSYETKESKIEETYKKTINIDSKLFDKTKNISVIHNKLFKDVINDVTTNGYTSKLDTKTYKSLWKSYLEEDARKYTSNIHLNLLNLIINDIGGDKQDIDLIKTIFTSFNKLIRDFKELPNEYNDNNHNLKEVIDLISHVITHTVCTYLYITLTRMLIKQIEETNPMERLELEDKSKYQEFVVKKLRQILDDKTKSTLIEYIFKEMPTKIVKTTLKIYDGEADTDQYQDIKTIYSKIPQIIKTSGNVLGLDNNSKIILDINNYVIPYYTEYSIIITTELFGLTKNFFSHISGMNETIEIYKNLN